MMKSQTLSTLDASEADALLDKIVFFKRLRGEDAEQLALLAQHTRLLKLEPGEHLLDEGSHSQSESFYAVVSGRVEVFADASADKAIGHISIGQVLGGLSLLNKQPRTATLIASKLNGAQLLATDFSLFGELGDFSRINLTAKLCFYRNIVQYTYWKLDEYRHHRNDENLAKALDGVVDFHGEKNSLAELEKLSADAKALAKILHEFNQAV